MNIPDLNLSSRPFSHLLLTAWVLLSVLLLLPDPSVAQRAGYWQQEVQYEMEIDFDVETHRFEGSQRLLYSNNSPDTLSRVYYHLYLNAFQPESMMDKRSRTIRDPDRRVGDRIYHLEEDEIGYQEVRKLTQDGEELNWDIRGTVMVVELAEPILPGSDTLFEMEFEAQVPVQVRRTGRHNAEGIDYSMAQWYPKMAEYDHMGWHPHPYIGREFHGVFGTYDVTIHIDRNYIVAATGYLQNPEEVGYGYETDGMEVHRPEGEKLTWHFISDYQHDFMWAADPDYHHVTLQMGEGPLLRFFYQTDPVAENASDQQQETLLRNWEQLPEYTAASFAYMNEHFGPYPYDEYMVIQGADGGMEYIMGTLITGNRSLESLVGVTVHELIHSWFQGVLANNESYLHWMDEGFTTYASERIMHQHFGDEGGNPFENSYNNYFQIVQMGIEEPMDRHADHYTTNTGYGVASYTKGMIFLHQLSYVIGQEALDRGLRRFYNEWKFKHPTGYDLLRIMEKESGIELLWYYDYWVKTTRTIDYGIAEVTGDGEETRVRLVRNREMPMPIDLHVEYTDGEVEQFYIPLRMMFGEKEPESPEIARTVMEDWPWVFPEYELVIPAPEGRIRRIEIDPSQRMADIERDNNVWSQE